MTIADSYDAAAQAYADELADELDHKPLDRHLLDRFAESARGGLVADLGCGPGHVARYLHDRGVATIGVDLSPRMIEVARACHPGLEFRVGDMTALAVPAEGLAGAILFYSIVHFAPAELAGVFAELRRVLAPGGLALVAFHVGSERVHVDELFGAPVSLDFQYHVPEAVAGALAAAGLPVIEHTVREPYAGVEYPSRRAYLLARVS
jgi:SAM-dependent methyltransferase